MDIVRFVILFGGNATKKPARRRLAERQRRRALPTNRKMCKFALRVSGKRQNPITSPFGRGRLGEQSRYGEDSHRDHTIPLRALGFGRRSLSSLVQTTIRAIQGDPKYANLQQEKPERGRGLIQRPRNVYYAPCLGVILFIPNAVKHFATFVFCPIPELAHLAASLISGRKTIGLLDTTTSPREDIARYMGRSIYEVGDGITMGMHDAPVGAPQSHRSMSYREWSISCDVRSVNTDGATMISTRPRLTTLLACPPFLRNGQRLSAYPLQVGRRMRQKISAQRGRCLRTRSCLPITQDVRAKNIDRRHHKQARRWRQMEKTTES